MESLNFLNVNAGDKGIIIAHHISSKEICITSGEYVKFKFTAEPVFKTSKLSLILDDDENQLSKNNATQEIVPKLTHLNKEYFFSDNIFYSDNIYVMHTANFYLSNASESKVKLYVYSVLDFSVTNAQELKSEYKSKKKFSHDCNACFLGAEDLFVLDEPRCIMKQQKGGIDILLKLKLVSITFKFIYFISLLT
jgi:hypothetical protein